jgi:hypothetical protein
MRRRERLSDGKTDARLLSAGARDPVNQAVTAVPHDRVWSVKATGSGLLLTGSGLDSAQKGS